MRIRRLGWAGIEIEVDATRAVIDLLVDISPMATYIGGAREPLLPPAGPVDLALVTHLHFDHTDPTTLVEHLRPGAPVLRPAPGSGSFPDTAGTAAAEKGLAEHAIATRVMEPWESLEHGPLTVTAVPAVDGFGDPQVSWVVEADGRRIFHGGDTIFHGYWWSIAARLGPFDAVFLPVNGAVCNFPHKQPPSPFPADLDPEQAAVAAHILQARLAVPIHYDTLYQEPIYRQVEDPAGSFVAAAAQCGVATRVLAPGDTLELRS